MFFILFCIVQIRSRHLYAKRANRCNSLLVNRRSALQVNHNFSHLAQRVRSYTEIANHLLIQSLLTINTIKDNHFIVSFHSNF